jgi:RHH-type proline utilization regulon transcriptional repressor/proline dehydrogenase/delta 1-pyrroline-5-carboxylate dehydrogenase
MLLRNTNSYQNNIYKQKITDAWYPQERQWVKSLLADAKVNNNEKAQINKLATVLVANVRNDRKKKGGLDAFMEQYDLSTNEGIVLMCLAEALLRIPDKRTANQLIQDKLTSANWKEHFGTSESFFVNAATWSLMITGRILTPKERSSAQLSKVMKNFLGNRSKPVIRKTALQAMKILGQQYVMGQSIEDALKRAKINEQKGYRYSYDMLGEAARTMDDADFYYNQYQNAIQSIGQHAQFDNVRQNGGISVKLSALHPRYEVAQSHRVHQQLYPRLLKLMEMSKQYGLGCNIDAEETERLELSLELIERLAGESSLADWEGLGVVVQAYQKRAPCVIDYLVDLAKRHNKRFMVRLVKGAYWDSEIKHAQQNAYPEYPVFTRKCHTDVSYHACIRKLFRHTDQIYPQFATHNSLTVATVMQMAGDYRDFEFQCLHGMGDALYDHIVGEDNLNVPCRIYAPVGDYDCLLPYLVRRLLENGANSSFVNRITDDQVPIEDLVRDPVDIALEHDCARHPSIPLPLDIYGNQRQNAKGFNLNDINHLNEIKRRMDKFYKRKLYAYPLLNRKKTTAQNKSWVVNPACHQEKVGQVTFATKKDVEIAMDTASKAFENWDGKPAKVRADCLYKVADLLEKNMAEMMALAVKEAGKSIPNAVAEVREAIDFCRYYAQQCIEKFAEPMLLPGPTGEHNTIALRGRGVFVCISPWNFPLAIFMGEITAALAAGNTVVAKPAEQTSIIAYEAVKLLYEAGIPKDVLQFLPGDGDIGAHMVNAPQTSGVIFTGSTQIAHAINASLAAKKGAIVPLIAETGGQNVKVVDSSALTEQVVRDVILSAFDSAGQRCSALRVLYIQEDVADKTIAMLEGAMKELIVDDPQWLDTDVGPVIDTEARSRLLDHIEQCYDAGKLRYQVPVNDDSGNGTYVPPTLIELNGIDELKQEVFGPILHVVRYKSKNVDKVIDDINATGYGLTFGIHSRIQDTIDYFVERIKVGNIYVNRDIVGAIVGVQPFGGQGLSGTGPKAGGPHYLQRLATERAVSIDTTAAGGNASLMSLNDS